MLPFLSGAEREATARSGSESLSWAHSRSSESQFSSDPLSVSVPGVIQPQDDEDTGHAGDAGLQGGVWATKFTYKVATKM